MVFFTLNQKFLQSFQAFYFCYMSCSFYKNVIFYFESGIFAELPSLLLLLYVMFSLQEWDWFFPFNLEFSQLPSSLLLLYIYKTFFFFSASKLFRSDSTVASRCFFHASWTCGIIATTCTRREAGSDSSTQIELVTSARDQDSKGRHIILWIILAMWIQCFNPRISCYAGATCLGWMEVGG